MKYFAILLILTSCVGLKKYERRAESIKGEYALKGYIFYNRTILLDSIVSVNDLYSVRYKYVIQTLPRRTTEGVLDIYLDPSNPKEDTLIGVIYFDDFTRNIELHSSSQKLVIINPLLEK